MSGYAKDIKGVLEDCERAFQSIQTCVAYDGTICKPTQSDLVFVAIARDAIREYCHLRDIKLQMWEERPPDKWGTCKKCGHKLYAVRTVTYNSETSHGFLICKNPDCVVAKCKEFKQREFYLNDGTRI